MESVPLRLRDLRRGAAIQIRYIRLSRQLPPGWSPSIRRLNIWNPLYSVFFCSFALSCQVVVFCSIQDCKPLAAQISETVCHFFSCLIVWLSFCLSACLSASLCPDWCPPVHNSIVTRKGRQSFEWHSNETNATKRRIKHNILWIFMFLLSFQHLTHPGSFRASLCQVSHEGYQAFQCADLAMEGIRLQTARVSRMWGIGLEWLRYGKFQWASVSLWPCENISMCAILPESLTTPWDVYCSL